jgi:RNA polymerase sigma factor (sigma-70 family)
MGIVNRPYGRINKGTSIPYGTLAGASQELISAYYYHGYMRDEDMPELPCPKYEHRECHNPEQEVFKKEMVRVVEEVLDTLAPRAKKVLCLRYGIGLTQDYSLEEVGRTFDVTRERIRQIEAKAMRHIKHPYRSDKLRELIGAYESTAEKEDEVKKLQRQWAKKREDARLRDEAKKQALLNALLWREQKQTEYEQELERVRQEDLRLRAKWEEIKPMVSDTEWIKHLKTANPEMYKELKYLVGDIWGYNADKVWEMYAQEK